MDKKLKSSFIDRFFKTSEESIKITSPSAQMTHYLKSTGELIEDIYNDGYADGLKEGRKTVMNIKKN